MSKVALFFPTFRDGGMDVFEASIRRQTVKPDVVIIADEQISSRSRIWSEIQHAMSHSFAIDFYFFIPSLDNGNVRHLAKAYNDAAQLALELDVDLLISLQDYIWIPEDGIEKFVEIHENNPNDLITGVTHISNDPGVEEIRNIHEAYTIFNFPFYEKPKDIGWYDVRATEIYNAKGVFPIAADHWEANWAAVPVTMFEKGIRWDEEYDKGIAYENADFAKQCQKQTGCNILIDTYNAAISLPHKEYWPQEKEDIVTYSNRWLYEGKWAT